MKIGSAFPSMAHSETTLIVSCAPLNRNVTQIALVVNNIYFYTNWLYWVFLSLQS